MVPQFVATHDRTHQDYQQQWDTLVPQGYRPISVSVYGEAAHPLYAAVWVKRAGPEFVGIHGAGADEVQTFFDTWAAQGFSPTILAATGSAGQPVFACVMEESSIGVSLTRFGVKRGSWNEEGSLEYWLDQARKQSWIPRWIASYGTAIDRRFAFVLDPNPAGLPWGLAALDGEDFAAYQQRFDAQAQQWARPALVTVSSDQRYLTLFRDDQIGPWVARHGMTSAGYQNEFDKWVGEGYFPLYVQAGGAGEATRFAALFAKQEMPAPRVFTVTGPAVPAFSAVDAKVESFMKDSGTRAVGVAVTRGGRLVFGRGYTWASAGYPITQPSSTFRIASCTKPITSVAIHQLMERGQLTVSSTMQSILNLQPAPGGTADPRMPAITVLHLLTHTGGWDRSEVYDLPSAVDVALAYGVDPLPVTKQQIAGYMAGLPLRFTPGAEQEYSNLGFLLLGLIIEALSGQTYTDYVRTNILAPLGLTRPRITAAARSAQPPAAVRQHSERLHVARSVIGGSPNGTRPLLPLGYGGEDYAIFDAFGGWEMAAVDYAKFLAAFAVGSGNPLLKQGTIDAMWTVPSIYASASDVELPHYASGWDTRTEPGGVRAVQHGGGMPGVSTRIVYRSDGWGFAVFCNGDDGVPDIYPELLSVPAVEWPSHDLFPEFDIPALVPCHAGELALVQEMPDPLLRRPWGRGMSS